jgi:uncharacterized protein YecT (DUF1311 family)
MRKITLPLLVIAFIACGASGASFDCSIESLNSTEQKICNDPDLSEIDNLLSVFYKYAMANSSNKQELKSLQTKWVKERNRCPTEYPCMANAYENRINELAVSANLTDPQNVTNSQLFTAAHMLETSLADLPSCESFDDINLDGKEELVCTPDCNGAPACSSYFFVSQEKSYRHLPELESGSYDSLMLYNEQDDTMPILKTLPGYKNNLINGWRILYSTYGYIKDCSYSATYYAYLEGSYHEIYSQKLDPPWKGCQE